MSCGIRHAAHIRAEGGQAPDPVHAGLAERACVRACSAVSVSRHTAYNLAGAMLPLLLSLLTIPIYIGLIGEARYGVLAVAFLLLGYFGLFDLGLGTATAQRIAAVGDDQPAQRADTFWTALTMNLGLGVVGGLLIWPVAVYFFGHVFNVEAGLRDELRAAIPWLALALPLATVSGVLTGALQGRSRFLELNAVSVLTSVLTQLVPLGVAWVWSPDLALLLPAVVATRVFAILVLLALCDAHVFRGQPRRFSRVQARSLLGFGGWVTVTAMIGPLMTMLDRFAIGATLDARAVTHYTVPFQLVEKTLVVPAALTSAIFPRLSAHPAEHARPLALAALRALVAVMTPLLVVGVIVVEPFLAWWLSLEFAGHAGRPAQILLLGFWINAFARVPYVALLAADRPSLITKCLMAELFPYLLGLYWALQHWGLTGAAVVFGIRTAVDCGLLMYFAGILRDGIRMLVVPAALMTCSLLLALQPPATHTLHVVTALALLVLAVAWAWMSAPPELRGLITRPLDILRRS